MGTKRIVLIGVFFSLLFGCGDDDYISDGECRTEEFVIINRSGHVVKIEDQPFDESNSPEIYEMSDGDSTRIERTSYMHDARPFKGLVYISFDSEEKSSCNFGLSANVRNVSDICYYKKEKISDDYFVSRYVITEEDYEYAKAHLYKGE